MAKIYVDTSVFGGCFDAVKMMREIRDRLSKKYSEYQEAEERDLQNIRKKYVT